MIKVIHKNNSITFRSPNTMKSNANNAASMSSLVQITAAPSDPVVVVEQNKPFPWWQVVLGALGSVALAGFAYIGLQRFGTHLENKEVVKELQKVTKESMESLKARIKCTNDYPENASVFLMPMRDKTTGKVYLFASHPNGSPLIFDANDEKNVTLLCFHESEYRELQIPVSTEDENTSFESATIRFASVSHTHDAPIGFGDLEYFGLPVGVSNRGIVGSTQLSSSALSSLMKCLGGGFSIKDIKGEQWGTAERWKGYSQKMPKFAREKGVSVVAP